MKNVFALFAAFFCAVLLPSCGEEEKDIPYSKLEFDGINVYKNPTTHRPYTGSSKDFHKNGQLRGEWSFKKGLMDGLIKEWYPNGKKLAETEFKEGFRTGKCTEWTEAGLLYQVRIYDHDKIVEEKKYEAGK